MSGQDDLFFGSPDLAVPACYDLACRRRGHDRRDCALNEFTRGGLATCGVCGAPVEQATCGTCDHGLAALQRQYPGRGVTDVLAEIMDEDDADTGYLEPGEEF